MVTEEKQPEDGAECEKSQKELDEEIKKKKERQVWCISFSSFQRLFTSFSDISWRRWCGCLHGSDHRGGVGGGHSQGDSVPANGKTAQDIGTA